MPLTYVFALLLFYARHGAAVFIFAIRRCALPCQPADVSLIVFIVDALCLSCHIRVLRGMTADAAQITMFARCCFSRYRLISLQR